MGLTACSPRASCGGGRRRAGPAARLGWRPPPVLVVGGVMGVGEWGSSMIMGGTRIPSHTPKQLVPWCCRASRRRPRRWRGRGGRRCPRGRSCSAGTAPARGAARRWPWRRFGGGGSKVGNVCVVWVGWREVSPVARLARWGGQRCKKECEWMGP